jgi:hypothetical protein
VPSFLDWGLLVDDAIFSIEIMVVKMEEGRDRVRSAGYAWSHSGTSKQRSVVSKHPSRIDLIRYNHWRERYSFFGDRDWHSFRSEPQEVVR